MAAFSQAEKMHKPPINEMFEDVYKNKTAHLKRQQAELTEHLKIYGKNYPLNQYKSG
jgi:2-oxoisovalerate dehydrogenase E1 component alpha subunit